MRRGEVLGARWSDLDLEAATLKVRQTVISVHYKIVFSTPKTRRGRRQIELDQGTVAALRAHRKAQAAERLAHPDYQDHGLIFCNPDGSPLHPQTFSQAFERIVARLGVPTISVHGLRHTHIELSLQAGVRADVVSRRAGHATVAFTLERYAHAFPAHQADAAEVVARLVLGS
jgi:integrase